MPPFLLGQVCLFSRGLLLVVSGNVSRFLQSNTDPAVQKIHNPKKVGPYQVIDEVISYNPYKWPKIHEEHGGYYKPTFYRGRHNNLVGGFKFHPYLGKWSNLTNIFQRGWNHHLEYIVGAPYNNSTSNDRLKGGFHLERSSRKTFNKELRRHREPPVALDGRCGGKHNSGWRIIPDRK